MSPYELTWLALRWAGGFWLLWSVGRVVSRSVVAPSAARPACTIVIPARDEERSLPVLLKSLAGERRAGDEVIVVDDDSGDATAGLAHAGGATVVAAPPLVDGWTGKNAACWAGARCATNDVLVFLDADTRFEPGGLGRVLAAHAERGGLVSVQPFHDVPRSYEQLSAYFNVIAMMGIDAFTPMGERRVPTGAFGPVLATSARDYAEVGGHLAVAGEVLDDVALARRYTGAGLAVSCFGGRGTVRFRMYPNGIGQLVEGWTKNFAGGAAGTRKLTLLLVAAWVSLAIQSAWWVLALPWRSTAVVVVAAVYVAVAAQFWWMLRRIGSFPAATAMLYPIPLLVFLVVFARSTVYVYVRRKVTWKGRTIPTRGA